MAFGISENWIGKAERLDRCAYLIDLALGMRARIARIGNEISDWTVGHGQPRGRFRCRYFVHAETPPKANDRRGFAPFENTIRSAQGEEVVVLNCWVTETNDTPWASNSSTSLAKSANDLVRRSTL